ncbi:hypothetical protein AALP_AA4G097000 [Arabis alpina]|uniref:HTH myb-type domain-containing protein n=1 Tax=Arabis alpina TaxID=50452 RepID=A0A087H293_ARAAL|nr:hypothetical protein AALP_AA4G097000 [Arabis alpina]
MMSIRWNDDLHRLFVHVVEQLGGEQKATPKPIFELMNRGELTLEQIKSHLQWYRITKQKEAITNKRQENIIKQQMIQWETHQHLRLSERLLKTAELIQNQQRLL